MKIGDRCVIEIGDARDVLARLKPDSIDSLVCDPPASISFMGKEWDSFGDHEDAAFGYYLAGLVDGEGCFRIHRERGGDYYACHFQIKLRADDRPILERARRFLGVGRFVEIAATNAGGRNARPAVMLLVDTRDGCKRVRAVFRKYQLRAKKAIDFAVWCEALTAWEEQGRGNRWAGPADKSRMRVAWEKLKDVRDFTDAPRYTGNPFIDAITPIFKLALRAMKPGAHGLVWALPRTSHWTATALEDAGFEVRDVIMHLFGTGFPKSLDVSKAIDAKLGVQGPIVGENPAFRERQLEHDTEWKTAMRPRFKYGPGAEAAKTWGGWGTALKPAAEHWILVEKRCECECHVRSAASLLSRMLRGKNAGEESLVRTLAEFGSAETSSPGATVPDGKVGSGFDPTGTLPSTSEAAETIGSNTISSSNGDSDGGFVQERTFTTETASGPTTGVKICKCCRWANTPRYTPLEGVVPDAEFAILVRKPLVGTVAENVLAHGTGGINVDACRIDASDGRPHRIADLGPDGKSTSYDVGSGRAVGETTQGRWPANVTLDEEAAALLDEQSGERTSGAMRAGQPRVATMNGGGYHGGFTTPATEREIAASSGGASRFFYVAKPGRKERDLGCEDLPTRSGGEATDREDGTDGLKSPRAGAGRGGGAKNHHPTVKSVALMRYLVRLVTPPGGIVLDPFLGSGSTGIAALAEGFAFVGVEREAEYVEIAKRRIAASIGVEIAPEPPPAAEEFSPW